MNVSKFLVELWHNYRDKHSYNKGNNNCIIKRGVIINTRFQVRGDGNKVVIEDGCVLKNCLVYIAGNNNKIVLHAGSFVYGSDLYVEDNGCRLIVGENSFIGSHSHLACTENGREILIGRNCLISANVQIRTGDSHSIYDYDGKRINYGKSVRVGDHVWIGEGAKILKGVVLQDDTVVGTGSIVTKSFDEKNIIVAGAPAKIIREFVKWDYNREEKQ